MHIALEDLKLDELIIIYPGKNNYQPQDKVFVCGFENYLNQS